MSPTGRYVVLGAGAVALAGLFVALGRWQLDRAAEVRAVVADYAAAAGEPPVRRLESLVDDADAYRFRVVELEGRYGDVHVLLDNITRAGAAGYYVLTPFTPVGAERAVLVNRGWIPADPDRRVVPSVEVVSGPHRVAGRIDRLPMAAVSLGGSVERLGEGLYRASFPTVAELEETLDRPLAPFQLKLDPTAAAGFERGWTPSVRRAGRNTAYAGQWFMMAVAALGLAAWATVLARRSSAPRGSR